MADINDAEKEFVIKRTFDAPRELVWKVWTEKEHLMKWFGPKGVTIPVCNMDFRVGGTFHYAMETPDGNRMWGKWVFREIQPPEKLVLVNSFSDEKGNITRHPLAPTWPREMLSTTTLQEASGKTDLTITWLPINAGGDEIATFEGGRDSMTGGWAGTFEQLESYLASIQGE